MSKSAKSKAGRVGGDVGELGRVCGGSVAGFVWFVGRGNDGVPNDGGEVRGELGRVCGESVAGRGSGKRWSA